ncbi:hypothetical protein ACVGVM_26850 [Pseudonocardia bannensis]|uniref:Uncharacterized protein n=1 Tax=Pseudonocardia bannensis TaxID=630973 RepID=A0A848DIX0_9PSEU|nr:hypothetical protein [Pseudonocardia bannensis]NMH92638.1 hypothetical protein [Pseudonocardia bannensis]
MDESEQRLSEALRARATQAGRPGGAPPPYAPAPAPRPVSPGGRTGAARPAPPLAQAGRALVVAFLAGAVLGCALALLSVLVPGLLPPLG